MANFTVIPNETEEILKERLAAAHADIQRHNAEREANNKKEEA